MASIGGFLNFYNNSDLVSLTGLNSLTSIGGALSLNNNLSLTSLTGLDNISPASIAMLNLYSNPSLSTCDVQSICDYLAIPGALISIGGNATGCNIIEEVQDACNSAIGDIDPAWSFSIQPNPVCGQSTINFTLKESSDVKLAILNNLGMILADLTYGSLLPGKHQINWDTGELPPGIYFCRLTAGKQYHIGKLIKVNAQF